LCLMQAYDKIDINAPFSMAFEAVGWKWAKYVVAVRALKGITSVLQLGPLVKQDINAPFSIAFEAVGWKWAKYVVAIGALKGMTSVLLVGVVGQAR
ncbi:hypothetical protein Tco_0711395, partial [Tanacetum coccineum]